jgi:2'-5' RNA ligase
MGLVAINVLFEPDAATVERARAINARLRADVPAGFALDEVHAPHVTLVQCFVREEHVARVAEALRTMLASVGKVDWQSRAVALYALTHENLGLVGIVIRPTPDFVRVQAKAIATLQPFLVATGTAEAFAPNADGSLVNQPTVDYVNGFIATRTGENYHPHLTVGIGKLDFVEALKAEPFAAFPVTAVSVGLYQLGNFGTARTKLHDLHRC